MGVAFLGSYLCISILEFKYQCNIPTYKFFLIYVFLYQNLNEKIFKEVEIDEEIYVFLYQNLNIYEEFVLELIRNGFMYFYIRI